MIRRSMHELDRLSIGSAPEAIPQHAASQLMTVARSAHGVLRPAGPYGILIERDRELHAGQVVGVLASTGASLEILPKIDGLDDGATRLCLVRMLARTVGLKVADGELAHLGLQQFDLLELLIGLFCNRLFSAVHRGLPRRYVAAADDLTLLRGRLDMKRQFTILAAAPQRLACQFEELSVDIPLNRLLKLAVQHLRGMSRDRHNQRRLVELEYAFADVSTVGKQAWRNEKIVLDRTNADWHDLVNLSQLLLGDRFQNTSLGEEKGFSLLFEMNLLFEKFIGRSLQRATRYRDLSVTLQKPHKFALRDLDGNVGRFKTKPDIVVHRDGQPAMIIDTKWKRLRGTVDDAKQGVPQADVYQMIAYGQVYNVKNLMLLYPHHNELDHVGIQSRHLIAGLLGGSLTIATVDLSDFERVGAQLDGLCGSQQFGKPHEAA